MIRPPPRSPLFPYTPLSRSPLQPPADDLGKPAIWRNVAAIAGWLASKPTVLSRSHQEPPASKSTDRKSTRLNSSHGYISYAVFCLKKKKKQQPCLGPQSK